MTQEHTDIQKIVHDEIQKSLGSFITRSWYVLGGIAIASATAWYSLYYQVQAIDTSVERNDISTQRQFELFRQDYLRDIREIKEDIRFIRDRL